MNVCYRYMGLLKWLEIQIVIDGNSSNYKELRVRAQNSQIIHKTFTRIANALNTDIDDNLD